MTDEPLAVGSRVHLAERHNWLTKFAPLAESRRPGTVVGLPHDRTARVEFDTVRPGAKAIVGTFFRLDLIRCDVPKREQPDMLLGAIP